MKSNRSLSTQKIIELNTKIDALDQKIHSQSMAFAREKDLVNSGILKAEIQELTKRKNHLVRLRNNLQHQDGDHFSEFAAFKYGNLSSEEHQAIEDLGRLFDIDPEHLKQDFSSFVHIMTQADKRDMLLAAIRKKGDHENALELLETKLEIQKKARAELEVQRDDLEKAMSKMQAYGNQLEQNLADVKVALSQCEAQAIATAEDSEAQLQVLLEDHQILRDECLTHRRDAEDAMAEVKNLEAILKAAQQRWESKAEAYGNESDLLKQSLKAAEAEADLRQSHLENCRQQKVALLASKKALETKVALLQKEIDRQKGELGELRDALLASQSDFDQISKEKQAADREIARITQALTREAEIRAFHQKQIMRVYQLHRQHWHSDERPVLKTQIETTYGYRVAVIWVAVNEERSKSAAVFEAKVESLLCEPEWQQRYCGETHQQAIVYVNDYQLGHLHFEDEVDVFPAETYPDLYRNLLAFQEHADLWKLRSEFKHVKAGTHPQIQAFLEKLEEKNIPLRSCRFEDFLALKRQLQEDGQPFDKTGEGSVE